MKAYINQVIQGGGPIPTPRPKITLRFKNKSSLSQPDKHNSRIKNLLKPIQSMPLWSLNGQIIIMNGNNRVFVTNMDVIKDPFAAFDAYDERSIIENSLFRETK
jgi:hypothetical protein